MKHFFLTAIFILGIIRVSHAATVSLVTHPATEASALVQVDVVLDPQGENINSVEFGISFPEELLVFRGYSATAGAIPLWVEEPSEVDPGIIHFSGVIPGGLERLYDPERPQEQTVRLARLLFRPIQVGSGEFSIEQFMLLRNDGRGSEVSALARGATISTTAVAGILSMEEDIERAPPQPFFIEIAERSKFGKTPRLALFAAIDNESGIHHYEARINSGNFKTAQSPYPLPSRLFGYTLTIRAVDFSGNTTDQQIAVSGGVSSRTTGIVALAGLLAIVMYIWRTRFATKRTL